MDLLQMSASIDAELTHVYVVGLLANTLARTYAAVTVRTRV